jgi:hypothetical protein
MSMRLMSEYAEPVSRPAAVHVGARERRRRDAVTPASL